MQIPILNGITTDEGGDFRTSYPLNLVPVPKANGIANGYLKTTDGVIGFGSYVPSGDDPDNVVNRGSWNWNEVCYRVWNADLVRIDLDSSGAWTFTKVGEVANDGKPVSMYNGFGYLGIVSAGNLYYYDQSTSVTRVTDPDLGLVIDGIWISGYNMTTDGESLIVTDLDDKYSVNPLKYGSSEASPDPVKCLHELNNEAVALNRYTTEFFQNVGGSNFPFTRNQGAMIPKGAVGTHASCLYLESFAFVGGGKKDPISVWIGAPGQAVKIATREIERQLSTYSQDVIAEILLESRSADAHELLYVHLPDRTLVYDAAASRVIGEPAWHILEGDMTMTVDLYRLVPRQAVFCYGKWICANGPNVGYYDPNDARLFGSPIPWQFDTTFLYNEARGAIFNELELIHLSGRSASIAGDPPTPILKDASIWVSWTSDGLLWSQPRRGSGGKPGETNKRTAWRKLGRMSKYRGLRFRGMTNPYPDSFTRLEATLEALAT